MEAWLHSLLAALALPKFGLSTVFVVALLSATLLPMGSEPVVFGLVKLNPDMFWPAVLVATAGNTVGGAISWWMGYAAERTYEHVKHRPPRELRALQWLQRFGPKACLAELAAGGGRPAVCGGRLAAAGLLALRVLHGHRQVPALCDGDGSSCCGSSLGSSRLDRAALQGARDRLRNKGFSPKVEGRGRSAAGVAGATMPVHARRVVAPRRNKKSIWRPPMQATPAYDVLTRTYTRLHRLGHLQSLAGWDQAANMPPKGNTARAAALSEMAALLHRLRTDPALADAIARAEQEALSEMQRANLREIRRDWCHANALPESLVQRRQLAGSRCEHAWRVQRPANDWKGFLGNFREVLAIAREEAALLSERSGLSRYDALMDRFEPGMTSATVDRVFGEVRQWLPGLICQVRERQGREPLIQPVGPVPGGRTAPPVRTGDPPARLRLRGRPPGREHAPVLRRRARGRAHDHALSRGRFPRQPDGHGARNRPWPLRAEPAARMARPAGGRGALDGAARKPVAELRDAARQPPRLRRAAGAAGGRRPSATSRPSSRATCTG